MVSGLSVLQAQAQLGTLRGTVTALGADGLPVRIPAVSLKLTGTEPGLVSFSLIANEEGQYEFVSLPPGTYEMKVTYQGFQPLVKQVTIKPGETAVEEIRLEVAALEQTAEVTAEAPTISQQSVAPPASLNSRQLIALPLAQQKLKEALPIAPGVVKTRDGKLTIKGEDENRGMLVVDSAETVEPVSGAFTVEIPIDAVESLDVYKVPVASDLGGFSGGLVSIHTKAPSSQWHYELSDFIPSLRAKNGQIVGIADDRPRFFVTGPLWKKKLTFLESFGYDIIKTPVRGLTWPRNEMKRQGFESFTSLQYLFSPTHLLTTRVNVFPLRLQFADISALRPQVATSDFTQRGFSIGATDRYQFGSGALLTTLFNYTRFISEAHGQGSTSMLITPEGRDGNFFNAYARTANQEEMKGTFQFPVKEWKGHHETMIGGAVLHRSYTGTSDSRPVLLLRPDNSVAQRIDFQGKGALAATDTDISGFAQDRWMFTEHLAVTFGARFAHQTAGRSGAFEPRAGLVYSPGQSGKTIFRLSGGRFYDRVPLLGADFRDNPTRVVSLFDRNGILTGPPLIFRNTVVKVDEEHQTILTDRDLESTPYNITWNAEVDQELWRRVVLRVSYLYSQTHKIFVIGPQQAAGSDPTLRLSNSGGVRYREFEATLRYHSPGGTDLKLSYVHTRTRGDLNTLSNIFVPFEQPVIRPNVVAKLDSEIPNRLVGWGIFKIPWGLTFTPLVDVHTGLPYSNVDVLQNYVGTPNSQRFPTFFSLDLKVYKEMKLPFLPFLKNRKFRLGVYSINVTGHDNPNDVFNNVTSPNFSRFIGFQKRVDGLIIDIVN